MFFDLLDKISGMMPVLLDGTVDVLKIFIWTVILSVPLGFLVALGRNLNLGVPIGRFRIRPISWVVQFYQLIMRGTPLMLQLMFVMYAPSYIFHVGMDRFTATILAFSINYAAYFSEIYRGGIEGIPQGQWEAGQVLGMTRGQIFRKVVLLQVVKRILAPMSNEVITLVKDTSLARVISLQEIIRSNSRA